MADTAPTTRPTNRRRQYVVDSPTQISLALTVLGVMLGVGVLYACALFFLLEPHALGHLSPDLLRVRLLQIHVAYFGIGGVILFITMVLLTHRFVGPAVVLRRAIERMRRGDYELRVSLRKRDYLKPLAEELHRLQADLDRRQEAEQRRNAALRNAIDLGDLEGARMLVGEVESQAEATAETASVSS